VHHRGDDDRQSQGQEYPPEPQVDIEPTAGCVLANQDRALPCLGQQPFEVLSSNCSFGHDLPSCRAGRDLRTFRRSTGIKNAAFSRQTRTYQRLAKKPRRSFRRGLSSSILFVHATAGKSIAAWSSNQLTISVQLMASVW